jgi:hypothetical protein
MPAKNKIQDLRDHLFETLEALRDEDKPMDIARAQAVADVARVIVDSAKVEVQFIRATGTAASTGFLPEEPVQPQRPVLRAASIR